MMWTFQAPSLSKSNSFTPGQSCWGSPPQQWPQRYVAKPHPPPQVFRSSVLTERYSHAGRPASSSPRPCYSWRSRALEPLAPASLCVPPAKPVELGGPRAPHPLHQSRPTLLRGPTAELLAPTHLQVGDPRAHPAAADARAQSPAGRERLPGAAACRGSEASGDLDVRVWEVHKLVQPSQPPPSLTNSAADWERKGRGGRRPVDEPPGEVREASTISPASHRHSVGIALSQDEQSHNSPSTVPQALSETSNSPDKENQPERAAGLSGMDPGSSRSAASPKAECSLAGSPASELSGPSPRQVLQPKHDGSINGAQAPPRTSSAAPSPGSATPGAQPRHRRRSEEVDASRAPRSEAHEAPRRKSHGDARAINLEDENQPGRGNAQVSSLVQEKISLWETMSNRPAKTSTSTTGSRGRSSGVSNSSWYRCFSDMARNMRQESAQMTRLMDRLREVGYDELGSPFSPSTDLASSPGESGEATESPETQKIKAQLQDMHRHMKVAKKVYRAMDGLLRMRSLEQAFANAEGQKSASLSLSTSPSPRSCGEIGSAGLKAPKLKADDDTTAQSEIDSSRQSRSTRSSQEVQEELAEVSSSSSSPQRPTVPLPTQEGMPRHETFLYHLEQQELHRQVTLIVPEGMDETRRVNFIFEDQEMTVAIPQGYNVGQQVTVQVPTRKRPPLEKNAQQAMHRGRQHLPDRHLVMENLRHCCRVTTSISLDHPEYKSRYQLYGMLQGKSMTPMLPETPEAEEESEAQ
eukprot:g8927.t1